MRRSGRLFWARVGPDTFGVSPCVPGAIWVRCRRILLWFATAFLSWVWFSTNPAPESCIRDGLDTCSSRLLDFSREVGSLIKASVVTRD